MNVIKLIRQSFENKRKSRRIKKIHELERITSDMFQVKECNKELWLTYTGNLVCPFHLFKDEPIVVISLLRKLYADRKILGNE